MYHHVLAATDFSQLGDRALSRGVTIAKRFGAKLSVVHVLPDRETTMYTHADVGEHVDDELAARASAEAKLAERLARETA